LLAEDKKCISNSVFAESLLFLSQRIPSYIIMFYFPQAHFPQFDLTNTNAKTNRNHPKFTITIAARPLEFTLFTLIDSLHTRDFFATDF
jgi:hypothetical protein